MVAVAQLVRVLDCDSRCRGFESPQPPHLFKRLAGNPRVFSYLQLLNPYCGLCCSHGFVPFQGLVPRFLIFSILSSKGGA
ncbi:hypothetical protein XAC3810_200088 [Xanthomonas citri pv. citri]|uniref:Uncharacterized protein n=1 Tax=Xanthomonas citri pv. citri TaxID=611301 RepID=A0A0U5F9X7_XANCI|nr:hypothetical protein XAC3824_170086 [Xanthomonas citri pv. citri]CEE19219.1 hypothetical protein XAC9322_180007 [Xanthomonas citri pv. citri]CEE20219.1 hypothetical protein XAC1083_180087 [Xanthomonas citri pv. citri]CEE28405.1 hypothetical protein XAC3810_200088 [Xanthomonas citri pv. citri]CEE30175.1 hypothetical protein XAC2911_160090 [Xanthomonas citri pv. citri]